MNESKWNHRYCWCFVCLEQCISPPWPGMKLMMISSQKHEHPVQDNAVLQLMQRHCHFPWTKNASLEHIIKGTSIIANHHMIMVCANNWLYLLLFFCTLRIIFYAIFVCFRLKHDCENICTPSNRNMKHKLLSRVRSWNNGTHDMALLSS